MWARQAHDRWARTAATVATGEPLMLNDQALARLVWS